MTQKLTLKIYNGRVKVLVDGVLFFCYEQLAFRGLYAYKDDTNVYGLDIYLTDGKGGQTRMEIYFKTKELWIETLKLLEGNL